MSDKFQNKYRIPSTRLKNWNYKAQGSYFITICTKDRLHYFGEIINKQMHLSDIGKIVETEWRKTFDIRSDMNLEQGEFIVMPNHFHAIIIIGNNEYNMGDCDGVINGGDGGRRDAMHGVSTTSNHFGPQSKNLASIVRGFKSSVTKYARLINADFKWQDRYHDHIIRDEKSFIRIQKYITSNPLNWKEDKFWTK